MFINKIIFSIAIAVFSCTAVFADEPAPQSMEERCGWFLNPSPANAVLVDKEGEWIIGAQGGHQAEGDWPEFGNDEWIKTNVNYGYGCACLKVATDKKENIVTAIYDAKTLPISWCRQDKDLTLPE